MSHNNERTGSLNERPQTVKNQTNLPLTSTKMESYLRFSTYLCFSSSIFSFNSRISFSFWSFWFSRSLSLSRQSSLSSSLVRSLARASSSCRLMFSLSRRSYRSLGKFIKPPPSYTGKVTWLYNQSQGLPENQPKAEVNEVRLGNLSGYGRYYHG